MKQAGRVRRPFQAQAFALILLCRILVAEFAKEPHHTADNSLLLEECVDTWSRRVGDHLLTRAVTDQHMRRGTQGFEGSRCCRDGAEDVRYDQP
jgi:hypothetical protein